MIVTNEKEVDILRKGGQRLATILHMVAKEVVPGVKVSFLNKMAEDLAREGGDGLSFLGYKPEGALKPYPAGMCISINDEAVHGVPNGPVEKILKEGDIVTLDMGLIHGGLYTDSAITLGVGEIEDSARRLLNVTKKALEMAIEKARAGNKVGEIGLTIEKYVKENGFIPAEDLGGHGLGHSVHEEPFVPNIGPRDRGPVLEAGMIIAIEPIVNEGGKRIYLDNDGFTLRTVDGKKSAQFEHTVLITDDNPVILTEL